MKASERFEVVDGVEMYRISNMDAMDPFLMTVVSSSDLWMFLSTTGGLTAGRVKPADCIFPYETDDRLHANAGRVGPVTILQIRTGEGTTVWEPFSGSGPHQRRSLFKSLLGDAVIFQEEHRELGLTFRYRWAPSERFGWVRTATLLHDGSEPPFSVNVVDGLLGVMPWGIDVNLQQRLSNLSNAYRRSEIAHPGIALYTLEAVISDRPEPSEALRATTVWSFGLTPTAIGVDSSAVARARTRKPFQPSSLITGRPGAFLLHDRFDVEPGAEKRWHVIADVAQSHADVAELRAVVGSGDDLSHLVEESIARSSGQLRSIVAGSDGIHSTGSTKNDAHHFANTLFNVMRGGTFLEGLPVEADRFRSFVASRNRPAADRHAAWLEDLPASIDKRDLRSRADETEDVDLRRLTDEYLPLGFSRRHGDPSRPWNNFTIKVRDHRGEPDLSYEGNWRDIFQNWEALCRNFPTILPSVISKFLNASTADGFNPYRITSDGIDWEVPEPDDPWSGIGYWGDHQIVYLLRLLEAQEAHHPGWIEDELVDLRFTFADVPYRIAPYDALVRNPKATVDYDAGTEAAIAKRVAEIGADGKLLMTDGDGGVIHVTFLEKLLIPMLAKLSNFVPRGGIWMNTERPEWNDANNALVGYGLSMVTLSYLRRYVETVGRLVAGQNKKVPVSPEVIAWIEGITRTLKSRSAGDDDPGDRARIVHELGTAYERYRSTVYQHGLSKPQPLDPEQVQQLCGAALPHLDDAMRNARRSDGLYHSYNLLRFSDDGAHANVSHLPVMLEGQVAAISSGLLQAGEVAALLRAMYASPLYREDVDSFVLYPATLPPPFLDKNRIPGELVESNPLLVALRDGGSGAVVVRDINGDHHFNADFRNAGDLSTALDGLTGTALEQLMNEHRTATLDAFEQVFRHHEFTGRSSTMYAYEGIGSVYWHMVAKLLVSVQEAVLRAAAAAPEQEIDEIVGLYFRVRDGLGFNKTAAEYGAYPTDPYSHTPAHAGAQQPGMTGQVKEELLTRWAELGVTIADGSIEFTPVLLSENEFRSEPGMLRYQDVTGDDRELHLDPGSLALTICQVPVVVHAADAGPQILVEYADGARDEVKGTTLGPALSGEVFERTGRVRRLDVFLTVRS
jgi:hypothetical protein